jgi:hypothetical protein
MAYLVCVKELVLEFVYFYLQAIDGHVRPAVMPYLRSKGMVTFPAERVVDLLSIRIPYQEVLQVRLLVLGGNFDVRSWLRNESLRVNRGTSRSIPLNVGVVVHLHPCVLHRPENALGIPNEEGDIVSAPIYVVSSRWWCQCLSISVTLTDKSIMKYNRCIM